MTNNRKVIQRSSLKELLDQLPLDQFIQTHRSFAVNIRQISHWDQANLYTKGFSIPISRGRRKEVKDFLESR